MVIKFYTVFCSFFCSSVNNPFISVLLLLPYNNLSGHMFDTQVAMPGDVHNKHIIYQV